ncbi:MAG: site-specific integrase [Ignavibacteria bacterium]|nr:site-specific integrase [Ignavibacteria bacterium]
MYLSKRSNGRYYIFYPQHNGKITCISTKTKLKNEALKFLSNFSNELDSRTKLKTIPISLHDFFFEYLKFSESIHSPKHTETLKATFNVASRYFGEIQLGDLSLSLLQKFVEERLKQVSVFSVKRDKANLSSAFTYGLSKKYLTDNIAKKLKLPKLPEKQPLFFSELQFDLLLKVIREKDIKDLVQFAIQTGLRQMELLTLEWNQINFKDRLLILDNRNSLTKSKKVRTIPLSINAMQIITERELNKNQRLVFTLNGNVIKPDFITHKFKSYVLKANINPKLNFHSLRHTFASWLVQRGVSIYEVSKLLGHSNISVTEIYSHLRAEDLRSAINVLNN